MNSDVSAQTVSRKRPLRFLLSHLKAMKTLKDYFQRTLPFANLYDYEDRVTAGDINTHVTQFNLLYQDCFSDHLIEEPCGDHDALHAELGDAKRLVDADNIDAYFMRNCVILPEVTQTANADQVDKLEKKINFNVFVKAITDPPLRSEIPSDATHVGENRVSYLLGDAGMGKTLACLKMLDIARSMQPDYRGYRIIPIYIDLHSGDGKPDHPFHTISAKSYRALTQIIIEKAGKLGVTKLATFSEQKSDEQLDANLRALALHLARNKFFLLFVFDNADRFYFDDAKYCFFDKFAQKRDQHIDATLLSLIDKFVSEPALGKIGASVLFVCRKYVYSHFRLLQDAASRARGICEKHTAFQLFPITGKQAVDSRLNLMNDAVKIITAKYSAQGEQYAEQLFALAESMKMFADGRDERTLNTILHLSHQGLRTFFDFLSQIEIDYRKDYQIIDRLFRKPHNLLRLYLTNMRKRFSQKVGHFPNIFLVDGLIDKRLGFEEAHSPHRHTYWLKYFLLKYVLLNQSRQVSSDELFVFFRNIGEYEEEIIRLAIGSLADPNMGRCLDIVPRQQTALHVQLLQVSDRGKLLADGLPDCRTDPLCFDFDYLQLVTDDTWLAIPTPWLKNIYVDASIAHTLKNHTDYAKQAKKTLEKKIPAVLYFLRVLRASLSWECSFRSKLINHEFGRALIPDFAEIETHMFSSLERILSSFTDGTGEKMLRDAKVLWGQLKEDQSFDKHFLDYERSGLLITEDM